jgi:paraquat-inducible protein A
MAYDARGVHSPGLIACPDCDLVQQDPACVTACTVRCRRCSATLYRVSPHGLDNALAFTLAAAILFAIANFVPVMSLELQGHRVEATLTGMGWALAGAGMVGVGALVFLTLCLMPGLEILARLYLLAPLRAGRVPAHMARVSRLLDSMRRWAMVEVFVLGAAVSIQRLDEIAQLELGPAFWAIGAVMLLTTATNSVFDTRSLWSRAARAAA